MTPLLVLGVGNPSLGDDGVGPRVAATLSRGGVLPLGTRVIEGGTRGLALLDEVETARRVIVVDGLDIGLEPGEIRRFTPDDLPPGRRALTVHEVGIRDLLALCRLRGTLPEEAVIWGIQIASLKPFSGLSPTVDAALPKLVESVRQEIRRMSGEREETLSEATVAAETPAVSGVLSGGTGPGGPHGQSVPPPTSRPRPRRAARAPGRAAREEGPGEGGIDGHPVRREVRVTGVVQGVGFRPFVFDLASRRRVAGWVRNIGGEVEIQVEGMPDRVNAFIADLGGRPPPLARVASVDVHSIAPRGEIGFRILESAPVGKGPSEGDRAVPPDAATCADCLRELFDPGDRRFRYPFVNCTHCGPRFTIIADLPYDRAMTSMARFPLCDACRREYEDPRDRRFHAQPVACPDCGPTLSYRSVGEEGSGAAPSGEAALGLAERLIAGGGILALKGLGGFHLACDARSEEAVSRLRERKGRYGKPLAIMVADLAAARALCHVSAVEEEALASRERPIVLLERRDGAPVAISIAPGLSTLGVMLPYTPLHHLLARDLGFPLVMTSGNRSDEPIATRNEEALDRLAGIADGFLLHNRDILLRYDDSVVREMGGRTVPFRRSRGFAPAPIPLGRAAGEEVLAFGAHQKNTFCFVKGSDAYLGPHVGDLENGETLDAMREAIDTYWRLFRLSPRVIAHDLHPDYLSTREALRMAEALHIPSVPVQHHHAHLAACLAEHGRDDRVLGLIFDGTGLGVDGTVWGGELLVGDRARFERCGHLAPVRMPGGAQAVRRPARMALAHILVAAPDREDLVREAAAALSAAEVRVVEHQVANGFGAPLTTSVGRLFDAAAVLLGLGSDAAYEGSLACLLEARASELASETDVAPLPYALEGRGFPGSPVRMDPGPILVGLLERRLSGEPVRGLALAFHRAVAALAAEAALRVAVARGVWTAVLSGGCFQNRILLEACRRLLKREGFEVLTHRVVPPNDGGLALGQAAVALALRAGDRR